MATIYRECIQCHNEFYLKDNDQRFYAAQCTCGHPDHVHDDGLDCGHCRCPSFTPLELPKRCWHCRKKNREVAVQSRADEQEAERKTRTNGGLRRKRAPQQPNQSGLVEVFVSDRRRQGRNR